MDMTLSMQMLAGVCGLVLIIVVLKRRMQLFWGFLLRMGVGVIAILWANDLLMQQGIEVSVGINPVSLLTSGSLGIPGVALLFAIVASEIL